MIAFIRSLPQLIALLYAAWAFAKKEETVLGKRKILNDLTTSLKGAQDAGNTKSLEDQFNVGP